MEVSEAFITDAMEPMSMPSEAGKTLNRFTRTARQGSLALVGVLAISGAFADEFYLKSGKVVRGALASETDSEYVLQTEMGTIKINKADVTRTVEQGTTAVEVEGDIATARGELPVAITRYQQALTQAPAGSLAASRLREKIQKLTSETRQAASQAIINDLNNAKVLLTNQQYDAAQVLLERIAASVAPTDPLQEQVKRLRANLYYGQGMAALDTAKVEDARRQLELAIQADPNFYPAYFSLGQSLMQSSATAPRGIELMEQGLAVGGDRLTEQQRYAYQYELAGKYFDQANYADAAAMYAELIPAREKYPAYADALDRAVESYVRMGEENLSSDFRETIDNLNIALRLNPTNQKALFLLGRIYLDIGQLENAIVSLKRLVQLAPTYQEANHFLGRAYFRVRDYDNALKHLSAEIQAHSDTYFALVDRAEVYIALGNYQAAEADLAAAMALDTEHWLAYYLTGLQAFKQNNFDQARTALMEALDRKRTAMPVHLLMGQVLLKQNQVDGARKWFEQVATTLEGVDNLSYQYNVYRAEALTHLGEIAITQNSPRQAVNYLGQALESVPEYAPAMVALADANLLMATDASAMRSRDQLYQEAEELYLKAISKDPENPTYYEKAGRFYHRYAGNFPKAREYYNLYVDKGGTDARANAWLVEVGGEARPELVTTSTMTMTTGTMTTTGSMSVTTGTAVVGAPTMAMSMPAVVTTSSVTVTTGTIQPTPPGQTMPGQTMPAMPQMPGMPQPGAVAPGAVPPAAPGAVPPAAPGAPGAPVTPQ